MFSAGGVYGWLVDEIPKFIIYLMYKIAKKILHVHEYIAEAVIVCTHTS